MRVLRFVGHGASDVLGPVCDPGDAAEAGAAILNGLREGLAGRWNVFLAERMPAGPLGDSMGGKVLQAEANPSLEIGGRSWDEYLAASSKNLREKLRRNTRKLEREHELRYRLCEDPNRLEQTLDTLFRLHAHALERRQFLPGRPDPRLPPRLQRDRDARGLAAAVDDGARRRSRCGLVRLPLRSRPKRITRPAATRATTASRSASCC